MAYKFNPFTGTFDLVEDNIVVAGSVWVDAANGNDNTGLVERRDKPFATVNAAWDAVSTHPNRNNMIFYIERGTYTLSATLTDTAWGTPSNRRLTFICAGQAGQTVINSAVVGPMITLTATGGNKFLEIQRGTWTRTGITGSQMFNISSSDNNEVSFVGMNINDQGGTGAIAFQRTTALIRDCRINCTNNSSVFIGSGANSSTFKLEDSTIIAPTVSTFFSSNTIRPFIFENSLIDIPTGIIATSNGNISATVKNSLINHSGVALDGRALGLNVENSKFTSITNLGQIVFDTQTGLNLLRADGLYLERPDTATQACLRRVGNGMTKAYIYGRGLYYSERTPPASGSDPNTTNASPNGRVGFIMPTATIGNVVTINLPGTMSSGTPYNTAPINYNIASTNTLTELTAMKALVDAQVLIPGTPWNLWCQGDTSLVRINPGGTQLWIIPHPFAPGYFNLSLTTNYSSDTLGDITNDANLFPDGIVDLIGGPQYPLVDIPRRNGQTDYPETLIGPILTLRQY